MALAIQMEVPSILCMRYLAWMAVFSLQLGMFVCGAGIDVCHAADAPTHIASSQSDTDHSSSPIDQTCVAHAAHVFLGQSVHIHSQTCVHPEPANRLASLNLPEILHLIEQPPKFLHS